MISLYTAKSQEQDEQGACNKTKKNMIDIELFETVIEIVLFLCLHTFRPEQVMVLVPKMTAERAAWLKESDHSLSAWW